MGILHELVKCFLPSAEAFFFMWLLTGIGLAALCIFLERLIHLGWRTDYDAPAFFSRQHALLTEKKLEEASALCFSGGRRALPRILAVGIQKSMQEPLLAKGAMREESQHMTAALERRLPLLVMLSNVSTLVGLLGTVFGLIMSFTAVSQPGVDASEKSSLLAAGISTAMNSTLVGLSISVLAIVGYAFLRARVDAALNEIDRYSVAILNLLNPQELQTKFSAGFTRRSGDDEEPADTDVTPMLNLMIILIPVLLTSSEMVKIGSVEMKLPEASQGGGGAGGGAEAAKAELSAAVAVTDKGFYLFHYFQQQGGAAAASLKDRAPDIPLLQSGNYDYPALNQKLAELKQRALTEVIKTYVGGTAPNTPLAELHNLYVSRGLNAQPMFQDIENIKIVGENKVRYQTVISVMDAARSLKIERGRVPLFPNVSIAGGIAQ